VAPGSGIAPELLEVARAIEREGLTKWKVERTPTWVMAALILTASQLEKAARALEVEGSSRRLELDLVLRAKRALGDHIATLRSTSKP
jgi:hypothetical protein